MVVIRLLGLRIGVFFVVLVISSVNYGTCELTAILPHTNRLNKAHLPPNATSSPRTRSTSLESGPFSSSSTGAGVGVGAGARCPPFVYDCNKFPADDKDVGRADVVDEASDDSVI